LIFDFKGLLQAILKIGIEYPKRLTFQYSIVLSEAQALRAGGHYSTFDIQSQLIFEKISLNTNAKEKTIHKYNLKTDA